MIGKEGGTDRGRVLQFDVAELARARRSNLLIAGPGPDFGLWRGGGRRKQGVQDIFPTENAFECILIVDDRQAGHLFLNQQSGGRLNGSADLHRNRIPAHDLMRPFVEGGPISVGLR